MREHGRYLVYRGLGYDAAGVGGGGVGGAWVHWGGGMGRGSCEVRRVGDGRRGDGDLDQLPVVGWSRGGPALY